MADIRAAIAQLAGVKEPETFELQLTQRQYDTAKAAGMVAQTEGFPLGTVGSFNGRPVTVKIIK